MVGWSCDLLCLLLQAERAAQEALAEFGGSGLGSMSVRKIDLRKKLNREAEKMKEDEKKAVNEPQPKRPRTRLAEVSSL